MKKVFPLVLLSLLLAAPAMAKTTLTLPSGFAQDQFKGFSTDLGLALSYIPLSPAEPLGGILPGFDLGVEYTGIQIDKNKTYWHDVEAASGNTIPSTLPFAKVHAQVGLPVIPLDFGVVYSAIPDSDIKYMGYELKYAILKGGVAMPAIALRAAYTKVTGIDEIDLNTKSLDISISKGFLILTPYAGIGMVQIESTPKGPVATAANLKKETINEPKGFVGAKLTFFPLLNLVAEADLAKVNAYSVRLNLHF